MGERKFPSSDKSLLYTGVFILFYYRHFANDYY